MTTVKIDYRTRLFTALSLMASPTVFNMPSNSEMPVVNVTVNVAGKSKTYAAEELEYMAAIRAAEACNLPNEFLLRLAEKYPPPAEWLDTEEEMPF